MSTNVIRGRIALGQVIYRCDNGYGASVVCHSFSYGGREGLFELAVLKFSGPQMWDLCYDTEITSDVIGWLDDIEVAELVSRIEQLPPHGEFVPVH